MTAKRRITLPQELCQQLDLKPGDEIDIEQRVVDEETVWVLKPHAPGAKFDRSWFGILHHYAHNVTDHSMDAIRESIACGSAEEYRRKLDDCA